MVVRGRDIIVLGECFVEFAIEDNHNMRCQGLGGDCLTTAAAAARLGSKVDLISTIGMDPFGDFIRSGCSKENINLSYTTAVEGYNGVYGTLRNDFEGREFAFYRSGSAAKHITSKQVHEEHIKSSKIVHSSSITQSISPATRKSVFKAFELCHINGGMVSYDPNLRLRLWSLEDAKEAMWSVMPFIDVIFPSSPDESKALFGYERPIDVIGFLWDHGINVVVAKNGENGCMVGYDGKIEEVAGEPVDGIKSFASIGSAFCGGFLYGVACGLDPFTSARIATHAASVKLKNPGSVNGLARAKDIRHLLHT